MLPARICTLFNMIHIILFVLQPPWHKLARQAMDADAGIANHLGRGGNDVDIDKCISTHAASHGGANSRLRAAAAKPGKQSGTTAYLGEAWSWKALPARVCTELLADRLNASNIASQMYAK